MSTPPDSTSKQSSPKTESMTKTVESGVFIRTTYRRGKQRKQTTERIKPNMKKVILGSIGEFEVYVYPFDYPDKVFIGKFPVSTYLDKSGVSGLQGMINICKWYLDGGAFTKETWRKAANSRRHVIQKAYDLALNELRSSEKARISH